MIKKLSILLATFLTVTAFSGCNQTINSGFAGTYWLTSPSFTGVDETCYEKLQYDITCETETDYAPKISGDSSLKFSVHPRSSYVTELYSENGLYVYKTTLSIFGEYVYGEGNTIAVEDFTQTETTFKGMEHGFAPVKTVKTVSNIVPMVAHPNDKSDFVIVKATITTEYGEKNAVHTLTASDAVSKKYLSALKEPVTVRKYNKDKYIDNELMLLLFRNFKYENSLSYTFKSIESATGQLKGIKGSAKLETVQTGKESSTQTTAIKTITIENCNLGDGAYDRDFNAFGVTFATTGEYGQNFAYAYYANSVGDNLTDLNNDSRHYMVKLYRPAIYNCCYIVYTLSSATNVRP